MDKVEARKIVNQFIYTKDPSKKDEESFLMAADYLVEKENDVDAMVNLGSYYYSKKKYLFAENYYLLANQYENDFAPLALGYIYFRGLNLKPDFEKAFFYFLTAYQRGNIEASIKIIDMLLDGIGTERNIVQAKQILKEVFNKIVNDDKYEYTIYSSCVNTDKGIYYYKTYGNSQITAVDIHRENLDSTDIITFELEKEQSIKRAN